MFLIISIPICIAIIIINLLQFIKLRKSSSSKKSAYASLFIVVSNVIIIILNVLNALNR